MTKHGGIWVGLLVMSSKDMAEKTRDIWLALEPCENIFGVFEFHVLSGMDKTLSERTVSSRNTSINFGV